MTINLFSSILVLFMFSAVFAGFIRVWGSDGSGVIRHLTRGIVWFAAVALLRSVYWDIAQPVLGDDWITVRDFLGGQQFSAVFNFGYCFAAYHILCAKLNLIPADERPHWHWWNAWLYPPRRSLRFWVGK